MPSASGTGHLTRNDEVNHILQPSIKGVRGTERGISIPAEHFPICDSLLVLEGSNCLEQKLDERTYHPSQPCGYKNPEDRMFLDGAKEEIIHIASLCETRIGHLTCRITCADKHLCQNQATFIPRQVDALVMLLPIGAIAAKFFVFQNSKFRAAFFALADRFARKTYAQSRSYLHADENLL